MYGEGRFQLFLITPQKESLKVVCRWDLGSAFEMQLKWWCSRAKTPDRNVGVLKNSTISTDEEPPPLCAAAAAPKPPPHTLIFLQKSLRYFSDNYLVE